jgi:hypothetical protein
MDNDFVSMHYAFIQKKLKLCDDTFLGLIRK